MLYLNHDSGDSKIIFVNFTSTLLLLRTAVLRTQMWPILTNQQRGLSVCRDREPCKNGQTDLDALWVVDSGHSGLVDPRNHVLDEAPDPTGEGAFLRRK